MNPLVSVIGNVYLTVAQDKIPSIYRHTLFAIGQYLS